MKEIIERLRIVKDVVTLDQTSLRNWEKGITTAQECIEQIKRHNRIKIETNVLDEEFEKWANSLGYRKELKYEIPHRL